MSDPSAVPPSITPIPADKMEKRGWKAFLETRSESGVITEHELREAAGLRLVQEKLGLELRYGLTPGGYDAWAFHEPGGGGAVIVPFAFMGNHVLVGLVEQKRPLQDRERPILNLPRGMAAAGERPFVTAFRETEEEMGMEESALTLTQLPGKHVNPNSTFFDTAGPEEGVKFFALPIPKPMLEKADAGSAGPLAGTAQTYELKKEYLRQDPASRNARAAEQILGARFVPATQALLLADGFTVIGVARLLAWLES